MTSAAGAAEGDTVGPADPWALPDPLAWAGYDETVAAAVAPLLDDGLTPGRVVRIDYGGCQVVTDAGRVAAVAQLSRAALTTDDLRDTPLAVGDWVGVRDDGEAGHVVRAVLARRTRLGRRDPSRELCEQVLAAHVDAALLLAPLDRPVSVGRLERGVVLCHEGGLSPLVVLTKADATASVERHELAERLAARLVDVPVLVTAARTGQGLDALRATLAPGSTTALVGESGAGKSTLANALLGHALLDTGAVRDRDAKGRHTTTARRLVPLADGRRLLDTPGTRELGLIRDTGGLDAAFAEVAALAADCRFGDCRHAGEAGCAVADAVAAGELEADRLASYVALRAEVAELDERRTARTRRLGEGRRPDRR